VAVTVKVRFLKPQVRLRARTLFNASGRIAVFVRPDCRFLSGRIAVFCPAF